MINLLPGLLSRRICIFIDFWISIRANTQGIQLLQVKWGLMTLQRASELYVYLQCRMIHSALHGARL